MTITKEIREALEDRFEAFELAEFLRVDVSEFLLACEDYDWINEDNLEELLEFAGFSVNDDDNEDESGYE